ncbi:hypothetical protein ACP70R_049432 [Stipagrostis hirtigluma subsp. patula]
MVLSSATCWVPLIDPIFYSATGVATKLYLFSLAELSIDLDEMGGFKALLKGSGNITSQRVKKQIVDYTQAMDKEHGENWQESDDLDGNVIYQTFGGLKNGRFAMGNGSFKKSEVIAAAKHNKARPSGGSYQAMQRQNEELQLEVAELKERDEEDEQILHEQQETIN